MPRKPFAAACALAVILLTMFGLGMHAAYGHAALVSGTPSCLVNGQHTVVWTISNDFNLNATVTASTPAGTTVVTPALPALGTTGATSTIPGTTTGTVTLTVVATWSDGFTATFTGSTFLPEPCPAPPPTTTTSTSGPVSTTTSSTTLPPPTTSTTAPPPTTVPVSTTTSPPDTTTTGPPPAPSSSTTTTGPPVTIHGSGTGTATVGDLPRTGGSLVVPLLLGILCACTGAALYFGSRYRRTVTGR